MKMQLLEDTDWHWKQQSTVYSIVPAIFYLLTGSPYGAGHKQQVIWGYHLSNFWHAGNEKLNLLIYPMFLLKVYN